MNLLFSSIVFFALLLGSSNCPAHAFSSFRLRTYLEAPSYPLCRQCSCRRRSQSIISVCMRNQRHSDEPILDSSRRSAMLRFTAMVTTAFISPDRATADDEAEIFAEESDEIDEFLFDEEEDDYSVVDAPTYKPDGYRESNEVGTSSDPWDRFTPRVTPTDESALSQAFANSIPPVAPTKVARGQSKPKSAASATKQNSISSTDQELSTDHMDSGSLFALSFPLMVLSGAYYSFERKKTYQYETQGTPKVKVVMIEDEPYGLDRGRRYYNGVNVVREFCDASKPKASNECVNGIAEFLDNVSHTGYAGEESQQTASAIISYLDSLSSRGSNVAQHNSAPQATGVAFSSYLQGLSEGSISAPSSAESVAEYLNTLTSTDSERLTRLESRVDQLESSMDDKVARELNKIATILVEECCQGRNVRDDPEVNGSGVNAYQNRDLELNGYQVNSFELDNAEEQVVCNRVDGARENLPML